MHSKQPYELRSVFVERAIQGIAIEGGTAAYVLQIGAPEFEASDSEWYCVWNLLRTGAEPACIAKGASAGADALQALLRSLHVVRAILDKLSKDNSMEF